MRGLCRALSVTAPFLLVAPALCFGGDDADLSLSALSKKAQDAVPDLLRRVSSKRPLIRAHLVRELIKDERDDDVIWKVLRYDLDDRDYSIILRHALAGLGSELPTLQDKTFVLSAVEYIAQKRALKGVDEALAEFAKDSDRNVHLKALHLLVRLKSPHATPHLVSMLKSGDSSTRCQGLDFLMRIDATGVASNIESVLADPDKNVRDWAVRALLKLGSKENAQALYERCVAGRPAAQVDSYTIAVLVKWEHPGATQLAMAHLMDSGSELRSSMARHLIDVGATPIGVPVISFLKDPQSLETYRKTDPSVPADMMSLLARLGVEEAAPVLREIIGRAKGTPYANMAAEALGVLRARSAIPELLAMLESERYIDWFTATRALAKIGEPSTLRKLMGALKRETSTSHHVYLFEDLCAATNPDTRRKLEEAELKPKEGETLDGYLRALGELCGLAVTISEAVTPKERARMYWRGGNGIQFLHDTVSTLNDSGYRYTYFLDDGAAFVLRIEEAYERWDAWVERRLPEPVRDPLPPR